MTDQQVLSLIESLAGDDFCADLDMRSETLDKDLATANSKLATIYQAAHAFVTEHSCYHVHDDWRDEVRVMYKALNEECSTACDHPQK